MGRSISDMATGSVEKGPPEGDPSGGGDRGNEGTGGRRITLEGCDQGRFVGKKWGGFVMKNLRAQAGVERMKGE